MTDRELLELAAKAAVLRPATNALGEPSWTTGLGSGCFDWNPLTSDGDALRLAVKIKWVPSRVEFEKLAVQDDPCAATRRAIVRAAAGIGRNMK